MIAAPVWHYWIGLGLLILTIGGVGMLIGGYLTTVSKKRYPPQSKDVVSIEPEKGS